MISGMEYLFLFARLNDSINQQPFFVVFHDTHLAKKYIKESIDSHLTLQERTRKPRTLH